ncbi:MAG: histidine triad nucleotide-binding protein [Candidatus Marinimicrobia bacterium]|jgi:histidine triad (HIT) family protein|nr:histidine triad nucleotide-binding protein [Candidatus Neomarinimicrobiota bacterium]MDD4961280.1 histidine triad nucleotide-binding protein [Candidatus Neomarinimicrobiota bacterium]MDD5709833.1 histidine triad nucleotide-binding protein [Candidatus Neomarinimicrobiota bacterium]MDX9778133.1 histidine triad nucleotide-binding protein [bacterium]
MNDCLFCRIAEGDIPAELIYRDKDLLAFRDINPQAPLHVLIIPRKHIARVEDLDSADTELAGKMILAAKKIAKEQGLKTGYRLVFNNGPDAGQEVQHIHLHLMGGRRFHWPAG